MNAASAGWDMACRTLGNCRHGGRIDSEIGDMVQTGAQPNFTGPKLFSYLRYDPEVTRLGLDALGLRDVDPANVQTLDSIEHMGDIRRVGLEYAKAHVRPEHFQGFV
jgi:hypothetical protein